MDLLPSSVQIGAYLLILCLSLEDSELTANGVLIHFTELFLVLVACHCAHIL